MSNRTVFRLFAILTFGSECLAVWLKNHEITPGRFLALEIKGDLKNPAQLTPEFCGEACIVPIMDALHKVLSEEDISALCSLATSENPYVGMLGVNALRPFVDRPEVQELLGNPWADKNKSYLMRRIAQMRLLNARSLKPELPAKLRDFAFKDFNRWLKEPVRNVGGRTKVLEVCKGRVDNPDFPRSKDWTYLCVAVASSDRKAAHNWIEEYLTCPDEFLRDTAGMVLERLDCPPRAFSQN